MKEEKNGMRGMKTEVDEVWERIILLVGLDMNNRRAHSCKEVIWGNYNVFDDKERKCNKIKKEMCKVYNIKK